ncbi:2-C-methyl-D-erythritol 2,4-cyclodiphosphate synthase [Anthocerotibacter panamensis]|uniref:2-C-methyl-D-erythritol 2,4-cyclodiphosphate synthase n=1 Tax=Anthocerotibacter panamensis TaxID=2857077 RepID=UPI001C404EE7|nr:2-C-methyl-D-erythritol 2,4-cyclodiphosphate synthase [Anthocerotibacter panamensis]
MRVGNGYDIHRLVPGRSLILGGVTIPYALGLLGHSDADVLTHAIMDALLGAAALGDIGHLFPPDDPEWKDISSLLLLEKVGQLVAQHNYRIVNLDTVIVAEAPKMKPHLEMMRANLSQVLGVAPSCVGIKATTNEGVGPVGRGEAICAHAVVLLE